MISTTSLSETLSDDNTNEHDNNYVTNEHNNEHVINDDNEHVINEHDSDDVNISISEGSSSTKQPPKLNLKDLQLVPIDKVPGKRSTDTSTGNFIGHLVSRHGITEESHKLQQQQSKQKNIDEVFQRIAANDPKRKARRDQKFISMLVKDQLPINIREGASFVEFLAEFDPNYQLPSKRHCRKLLTDAFLSSKEHLKEMLSNNFITCSLTCDLWTGRNCMGYLGVTCTFIDNDFQLNEIVLTLKYLPYPHTGKAIADALNFIIDDWKLTDKVFTITMDNSSNMVKATKCMPNIVQISCTAHTLQCAIGKGLLDAETLIAHAKRLMLFFTTPKQTERLIDIQKNLHRFENIDLKNNDHQLQIIADVPTKWNSSFLIWKRLLQIQGIISVMIANLTLDSDLQTRKDGVCLEKINLTSDEWNAILLLTEVLRPFAEATELLGGSKYAMISFMYSAIAIIEQGLLSFSKTSDMDFDSADDRCRIKINNSQDCTNLEGKIKLALYDAMIHYWNVPSDEAMLVTLLDPWCKPFSFISESLKKKPYELLKTKYEESQVMYGIEENDNLQSQSNSLLASMFQNRCPWFEVSDYLGA
ncbi:8354_t:CDS:2 [Cetraspora pellucida]|uniref:8354_t:CDS:1 n=1 Tax=Cetraspora pellucida TaxID=1433469 RepID=A0ACA9KJR7_9GLOM|nr:8354_t:CDS:2 [Cetraspora pellucida]